MAARGLLFGVACGALLVAYPLMGGAPDAKSSPGAPELSLSTSIESRPGVAKVRVRWDGIPASSILALSLDSDLSARTRLREVRHQGVEQFGITLVRTIGLRGADSLELDSQRLFSFFHDSVIVVSAHAVPEVQLEVLTGNFSIKGGWRVARAYAIDIGQIRDEFAVVCSKREEGVRRIFLPTRLHRLKAPDTSRVVLGHRGFLASATSALDLAGATATH